MHCSNEIKRNSEEIREKIAEFPHINWKNQTLLEKIALAFSMCVQNYYKQTYITKINVISSIKSDLTNTQ